MKKHMHIAMSDFSDDTPDNRAWDASYIPTALGGFDLEALRLPQDFGNMMQVQKLITQVPVRKPDKREFFRVRSGPEWRFQAMVLLIREGVGEETFLVARDLWSWSEIASLLRPVVLHAAIDRDGNVLLIPVPLPGAQGRRCSWHQSLAQIVELAEMHWVRLSANHRISAYEAFVAQGKLSEPDWPALSLMEMLDIAFQGRIIDRNDHPVLQQLLGLV